MPRVTVVIPAYNAERFIDPCLDSVEAQSFRDFDVVVADDGSSDRTADLVAARTGVKLLRRRNAGPAAARNDAVDVSTGELIALLDADDAWCPDKLARQVALFDAAPEVLLAATASRLHDREQASGPDPIGGCVTEALIEDNFVATSSVMLRRSAFELAGGFDADPRLVSVEDYDLWLRLSLLGPFGSVNTPLVLRREHEANLSGDHLELAVRTLRVVERFAERPDTGRWVAALTRRRSELSYRIGRAYLSRGARLEGREALRRSRALSSGNRGRVLALEALSWLPESWLLKLHELREERRDTRAATATDGPR